MKLYKHVAILLATLGANMESHAAQLIVDEHVDVVRGHCAPCHSLALITQNRMTRETWLETIRWMQKKQGLWPLGEAEPLILDYLSKHYAPVNTGRRPSIPKHLMPPTSN